MNNKCPKCPKCESEDVERYDPNAGAKKEGSLPPRNHSKFCKCNKCGHEFPDNQNSSQ